MTHETDFLDLYRQLGLRPGCELSELKQAYRRRVAILHPDRQADRPVDSRAAARLQRLTAQYGAAMDFHRRHGRMPGAPASTRVAESGSANERRVVAAEPFTTPLGGQREAPVPHRAAHTTASPRRRSRGRLAALLVLAAVGVLAWSLRSIYGQPGMGEASDDTTVPMQAGAERQDDSVDAPVLRLGMSADEVRAMEGDPVSVHGDLWEYGPSWVRFDHERVVDWHNSPLRALHTGEKPAQGGH